VCPGEARYTCVVTPTTKYRDDTQSTRPHPLPAGGSISALVTIPIDVLVATFQSSAKAGKKVSITETFREQGGAMQVLAFSTRGLVARVAHVAATTFAMKTVTSWVYAALYP